MTRPDIEPWSPGPLRGAKNLQNHKKRLIYFCTWDNMRVYVKKKKDIDTLIHIIRIYTRDIE